MNPTLTIALAGNPNVGKSTLFNELTGLRQKIANYAGVTIEKKSGYFETPKGKKVHVLDLPGTYSLSAQSEDEMIATKCILGEMEETPKPDIVFVMVEALRLDQGLHLFFQIQTLHPQAVLVINMMDELTKEKQTINKELLSKLTRAPVFLMVAKKGEGVLDLISYIEHFVPKPSSKEIDSVKFSLSFDDIDSIVSQVFSKPLQKKKVEWTDKIDSVLLHPVFGFLIFFGIMYFLFQSLFTWAAPFTDAIESGISFLSQKAGPLIPWPWVQSFVCDGILAGVGSVVVFVPQIAITFILVGFLETTGYLARGAFLVDRLMKAVGLEGRSFIPLISSFACAIPGIMATRTIPNKKQKLLTILASPFMTCSARLPVYTLLIATFVPNTKIAGVFSAQGLTLFSLFLLGIFGGMLVTFVMNKILPSPVAGGFFLEMPRYRLPTLKNMWYYVSHRVWSFLRKAGTIIFILSIILWVLAYFPRNESLMQKTLEEENRIMASSLSEEEKNNEIAKLQSQTQGEQLRQSYMGKMGHIIEPAIRPLGFDWKLGIGLLSSFAAREVFVSTMGIVFSLGEADENSQNMRDLLQNAKNEKGEKAYTIRTAFSLLVFFALAAQCMSTLAIIRRETNSKKWPFIVFGYMTILAYLASLLVYQGLGWLGVG